MRLHIVRRAAGVALLVGGLGGFAVPVASATEKCVELSCCLDNVGQACWCYDVETPTGTVTACTPWDYVTRG